jgi:hypothetical protein
VTRLWVLTAVLLALALAGCGPDCDAYCKKIQQCRTQLAPTLAAVDVGACVLGCNDSGSSKSKTIQCVVDHTCTDIAGGHCSPTGQPIPLP